MSDDPGGTTTLTADGNLTSKTIRQMNTSGNRREWLIDFVPSSTTCDVVTPLLYIDDVEVEEWAPASTSDRQVICTRNSNSTTENVAGYGGQVHITAITSGGAYTLTARGA